MPNNPAAISTPGLFRINLLLLKSLNIQRNYRRNRFRTHRGEIVYEIAYGYFAGIRGRDKVWEIGKWSVLFGGQ